MTKQQLSASDPLVSAWVLANAGTGKTKVLVDRVLRLLLQGADPEGVLCLTFTKAAASEMLERILHTLGEWSVLDDEQLNVELCSLAGRSCDAGQFIRARTLFRSVLDSPDGLNVKTIHSFCQSLILSFPVESGVPPFSQIADDQVRAQFFYDAQLRMLDDESWQELAGALTFFMTMSSEWRLTALLQEAVRHRHALLSLRRQFGSVEFVVDHLHGVLGEEKGTTIDGTRLLFCQDDYFDKSGLLSVICVLQGGSAKDQERAGMLQGWCNASPEDRLVLIDRYVAVYLRKDGEVRSSSSLATKRLRDDNAFVLDVLLQEQERVMRFMESLKVLYTLQSTASLLLIAYKVLDIYESLKGQAGYLEFDDLVYHVACLLSQSEDVSWVLYKVDGSVDHVLIDEAQDMSSEQWAIVKSITQEFFAGDGGKAYQRTIFVVGDDKQSIYSFQGASPALFCTMRDYFSSFVGAAGGVWRDVTLGLSFRSTAAVLNFVDEVFVDTDMRKRISSFDQSVKHDAFRAKDVGHVELWPLTVVPDGSVEDKQWQASDGYVIQQRARHMLAQDIAQCVRLWLDEERPLVNKGRSIQAGDIMVLVRNRSDFMELLVKAFKQYDVPVAGVDRLELKGHLMVDDLLSLACFLLLPDDSLSLAEILRSPLIGLSEDDLFVLSTERDGCSLWRELCLRSSEWAYKDAFDFLQSLLRRVDVVTPYELYVYVLDIVCRRTVYYKRFGMEIEDAIDEFLSLVLTYESLHIPSLQGFVQWMEEGVGDVKRDMEQVHDAVRVMTVHGSKGLQAPIVFLPDTCHSPVGKMPAMMFDADDMMFCALGSGFRDSYVKALVGARRLCEMNESMRLLYVAMTRAEDELYIAGAPPAGKLPTLSWYGLLEDAMMSLGEQQDERWVYHVGVSMQVASVAATERVVDPVVAMPLVFRQPVEVEALPDITSVTDDGVVPDYYENPYDKIDSRVHYGTVLHYLLHALAGVSVLDREMYGQRMYHEMSWSLPKQGFSVLLAKVMTILSCKEFQFLFGEGSLSEVPLCGVVDEHFCVGRVDRLVVQDDRVIIVDYKTSSVASATEREVPKPVIRQMSRYRTIVQQMYPGKRVVCALLWTSAMRYMELTDGAAVDQLELQL